jgi:hypothetical protein
VFFFSANFKLLNRAPRPAGRPAGLAGWVAGRVLRAHRSQRGAASTLSSRQEGQKE